MIDRRFRVLLPLSCLIVVIACDDGPGFWNPSIGEGPPPPSLPLGSYVVLSSETGDFIGAGQDYAYTNADSLITVTAQDGLLTVDIDGEESAKEDNYEYVLGSKQFLPEVEESLMKNLKQKRFL